MVLTIMEISKENHASRVVKILIHASRYYAESRLTRIIKARSRIRADNLGPIMRHGKPLCHSVP